MKFDRGHLVLVALAGLLLLGTLGPWWLWGERIDAALTLSGSIAWLKTQGDWAGGAGVGLLMADVILPIPATIVMSALGSTYGTLFGGLLAALGSILGGLLAYGLARWLGRPAAIFLVGEAGLTQTEALFKKGGAWLVLTSRWLPILPEAVACLAGLARMPFHTFASALVVGSLPMGFAFAAIGAMASDQETLAIVLSVLLPTVAWLAGRRWAR